MFSFLKKKPVDTIAPPPPPSSVVSKFDTKLESRPLPPPAPLPSMGSLPPLPPLPKPVAAPVPSPLPSLPKLELPKADAPKPVTLPPLPRLDAKPVTKLGDVPPISVAARAEPQKPIAAPVQPIPLAPALAKTPVAPPAPQPVKLENSKLAKALEELNAIDFDLSEPTKPVAEQPKAVAAPLSKKGSQFVSLARFDEALIEIKTTEEHLAHLQNKNERLGMIETQTKAQLDALVNSFEYVQRHILVIDEKMFKVN